MYAEKRKQKINWMLTYVLLAPGPHGLNTWTVLSENANDAMVLSLKREVAQDLPLLQTWLLVSTKFGFNPKVVQQKTKNKETLHIL